MGKYILRYFIILLFISLSINIINAETIKKEDVIGKYYKLDIGDEFTRKEQYLYINDDNTFYLKKQSYYYDKDSFKLLELIGDYRLFGDNLFLFVDKELQINDNYVKKPKFLRCKIRDRKIYILTVMRDGQLKYFEVPFSRADENNK